MHLSKFFVVLSLMHVSFNASGTRFDDNDFIISSVSGEFLGVYSESFEFKGPLGESVSVVTGLDFNRFGHLVSRGRFNSPAEGEIVVFDPSGFPAAYQPDPVFGTGGALDVKVLPNGNYLLAAQDALFGTPNGLLEMSPDGTVLRQFDEGDYEGAAVLPDGTIWGGGSSGTGFLNVFDYASGNLIASFQGYSGGRGGPPDNPLDEGQRGAHSMFFSAATGTVLIADRQAGVIYERNPDVSFVRKFEFDEGFGQLVGVTRGPGGDVFAVSNSTVTRWQADGTFVETIDVMPPSISAWNIVWTGNAEGLLLNDFDGSGLVEQGDLDLVLQNWGLDTQANPIPARWFNDLPDGLIDQAELDKVLLGWGDMAAPGFEDATYVPGPAVGVGAVVLIVSITRRRRSCT